MPTETSPASIVHSYTATSQKKSYKVNSFDKITRREVIVIREKDKYNIRKEERKRVGEVWLKNCFGTLSNEHGLIA